MSSIVLGKIGDASGAAIEREIPTARVGYQRSSRDAYLSRLAAKNIVEQVGRGQVKAAALLF